MSSPCLLLVDDEPALANLLKKYLERLGYQVDACTHPREALKLLDENPERYRLLVTDLTLPDMNGGDLMDQFARQGMDSPVCIVTGDISPRSRLTVQRAAAYLMKPFDVEALLRMVSQLTRPHAVPDAPLAG